MRFRRIAVRNFKKLLAPVAIEDLGDGVTIIAGDNEEGKSTLLEAIRAGLFERHNVTGKAADEKQPFGSAVRPEVCIEFDLDGETYRIEKGFAQRPSARLTTPGGTFEGPAAEERLAELLLFRQAQRGASRLEDQGVLGLLCLEQGRIIDGLRLGEYGRQTIRGALEDEVGDVLGGPQGQRLLRDAKEHRDALLTATGKPRGELKGAVEELEAAQQAVAALAQARREYDEQIDELARLQRELDRIDGEGDIELAREAVREAKRQVEALEMLRQRAQDAARDLALAQAGLDNAAERWRVRKALVAELERRREAASEAVGRLRELDEQTEPIERRLAAAREALTAAVEASGEATERAARSRRRARLTALVKEGGELASRLEQVDELEAQRHRDRQQLAAIAIDEVAYARMQALAAAIREQQAGLRTVATRLRFVALAHQVVTRDGEVVPGNETVDVTAAARFELEGFGTLEVEPGATELAARRSELERAELRLRAVLEEAGVDDLEGAKARFVERTKAEARIKEAERLIAAYAPEGTEALRRASRERARELADLGEDPERGADAEPGGSDAAAELDDPDAEEHELECARRREGESREELEAARDQRAEHDTRVAHARGALEAATESLREAEGDLSSAREELPDVELVATFEQAQAALRQAEQLVAEAERELAVANPDLVEGQRRRAEEALESARSRREGLDRDAHGLRGRLAALGRDGLEEQLEAARGRAAQALARRDRLQADADAWALLVTTLAEAERDAKQQFLEPVLARVDPFLRLLLSDARITFSEEDLDIAGIERDGRTEPFQSLSVGTREQLSILVRLAFAVYLREKGYPAAVILDDALVYADDDRFDRMQLALRKAAETVQILILTCRPRDWRMFGAPIERLSGARASAQAAPMRSST